MTGVLAVAAVLAAIGLAVAAGWRTLDRLDFTDWTLRPDELHDDGGDR